MPGLFFFAWRAWPSRRPGSRAASSKAVQGTALQNAAVRSGAPSLSHLRLARGSKRAADLGQGEPGFCSPSIFWKKKQKSLSRAGFPCFLSGIESGKEFTGGDDWPLAGLFFELKTEPAVNCKAVFLAGNPPASWNFINQ